MQLSSRNNIEIASHRRLHSLKCWNRWYSTEVSFLLKRQFRHTRTAYFCWRLFFSPDASRIDLKIPPRSSNIIHSHAVLLLLIMTDSLVIIPNCMNYSDGLNLFWEKCLSSQIQRHQVRCARRRHNGKEYDVGNTRVSREWENNQRILSYAGQRRLISVVSFCVEMSQRVVYFFTALTEQQRALVNINSSFSASNIWERENWNDIANLPVTETITWCFSREKQLCRWSRWKSVSLHLNVCQSSI